MSDVLRVQWTIIPRTAPRPWLACSRCGETKPFRSSDKIRLNANGKRVDAWLIYKCTHCNGTWNCPVLERRPVQAIDPAFLAALRTSDADLVRRLAFDVEGLRRRANRVEAFDDVQVSRRVLSGDVRSACRLEILCVVPEPVGLRMDRLFASELGLSRSGIQRLERSGVLAVHPPGASLRRAVRHGTRLIVDFGKCRAGAGFEVTVPTRSCGCRR